MWVGVAFLSALMLGLYDVAKKRSLMGNAVVAVLWFNTFISTLIFLPVVIDSEWSLGVLSGTSLSYEPTTLFCHMLVAIKAVITLSSWICGYYAMKHLPLSIVGPVNATRPVVVLVGAVLLFGERLNLWQWGGVLLTIASLYLLSVSSKKENVSFSSRHAVAMFMAMLLGAVSGLFDKYIISEHSLDPMFVQSWFSIYQLVIMTILLLVIWYPRRSVDKFHWSWAIPLISIFVSCADFCYYHAIDMDGSMIAVISMIRRFSVVVSFVCAALIFGEKNLRSKALDMVLILIGMILLAIGSIY
ncbi:MAG: EamA family transporter [Alistipes sp.]|nr:EamA family transporter [Alistipes sp.]MBR5595025.1 EamA family transporter [Alistipes sp.]